MEFICRHCGEKFKLNKADQELYDDGEIERPECCQDCFEMIENSEHEYDYYSDADPGL